MCDINTYLQGFIKNFKNIQFLITKNNITMYNTATHKKAVREINKIDYHKQFLNIDYNGFYNVVLKDKSKFWNPSGYLENVAMPEFVRFFYAYVFFYLRIPSPLEYCNFYFKACCYITGKDDKGEYLFDFKPWADYKKPERRNGNLPAKNKMYLKSFKIRINKIYPSLIREIAFLFTANSFSSKTNIEFKHDTLKDTLEDVDVFSIIDGQEYHLSLFNDTPRSREKRIQKVKNNQNKSHTYYCKVLLPTYLHNFSNNLCNTATIPGGLELYNKTTICAVINFLNKHKQGNYKVESNNLFSII